jgi:pimeloyl-ACP methyl ester carboxylesterase
MMSTAPLHAARAGEPGFIRTVDGVNLFYRDWGQGEPVVFVAGWSLPSESWNYQMLALSEQGLRCVAFDRRGHGRSSDPGRGYDFDTLAEDLAAVLDVLDLRGVTLVGHSMASGEIVRYLTRHGGDRVARIALLGATTPLLFRTADNPDGIDASYFEAFRRDELMRDFPKWIEDNLPPFVAPETSPQVRDWLRGMVLRTSGKALLDTNRAVTTVDFREELPKITVPTLVIHGDRDLSAPLDITGRRTADLMPSAKLRVYEGAPHGLFVTHIDRLNRDLLDFARGQQPA